MQLIEGERYNWKHQKEILMYKGKHGCWNQFALVQRSRAVIKLTEN